MTPVISITPPRIIELNEVSGSVETNSSSKRARSLARVPHPTQQLRRRSKSNLPIGVNYRLTMPGLAGCLNVREPVRRATVSFRIQTGLRDLIHGLTKGRQRKPRKWRLGSCLSPVSFYYLLSLVDSNPPSLPPCHSCNFTGPFHTMPGLRFADPRDVRDSCRSSLQRLLKFTPPSRFSFFLFFFFPLQRRCPLRSCLRFRLKTESSTSVW